MGSVKRGKAPGLWRVGSEHPWRRSSPPAEGSFRTPRRKRLSGRHSHRITALAQDPPCRLGPAGPPPEHPAQSTPAPASSADTAPFYAGARSHTHRVLGPTKSRTSSKAPALCFNPPPGMPLLERSPRLPDSPNLLSAPPTREGHPSGADQNGSLQWHPPFPWISEPPRLPNARANSPKTPLASWTSHSMPGNCMRGRSREMSHGCHREVRAMPPPESGVRQSCVSFLVRTSRVGPGLPRTAPVGDGREPAQARVWSKG